MARSPSSATRKRKIEEKGSLRARRTSNSKRPEVVIPADVNDATIEVESTEVKLTNLQKIFWPKLKLTKRDLLQYYADVSPWLLPHVQNRAMVMKRYPNGISGEFFFMKTGAGIAASLHSSLLDRTPLGKRDRFPRGSESCDAAVDREPGLHRPESLVRALR